MQRAARIVRSSRGKLLTDEQQNGSLISKSLEAVNVNGRSGARAHRQMRTADRGKRSADFMRSADRKRRSFDGGRRRLRSVRPEQSEDVELSVARNVHFSVRHDGNEIGVTAARRPCARRRLIERLKR